MAGVMLRELIEGEKYGLTEWQERHNRLLECENSIRSELGQVQESFVYIGYYLSNIQEGRLYETVYNQNTGNSCRNVFEYAFQELDLARTTVYSLMAVALEFSGTCKGLLPEYKDYSFSQLVELLSFTPEQRKYADPHLTVKQLRALKKGERVSWTDKNGKLNYIQFSDLEQKQLVQDSFDSLFDSTKKELDALIKPKEKTVCSDVGTEEFESEIHLAEAEEVLEELPSVQVKEVAVELEDSDNIEKIIFEDEFEFTRWYYEFYNKDIYPLEIEFKKR